MNRCLALYRAAVRHRSRYSAMLATRGLVMVATCLCAAAGRAADPLAADSDFVRRAEQSATQEIADAQGALALSKDPAIRDIAKRITEDGRAATRRLNTLAIEKGWPAPALDPPDSMGRYSDQRYLIRQITAQREALTFYNEEATNGADTALQEFARGKVPVLRHRLALLRSLRGS